MLSTRSLYSNEVEFYRRSDQRGMSLGHTSSLGDQYDTNSQLSRNNSPPSDTDKSAPPRKRVPVACGRCRKRKIKCSGDEGGSRGCSNCRNAGFAGCQFLRVQSSELLQYQTLKGWQMSHRFSPYSSGVSSRFKSFATPQYGDSPVYGGLPTATNFDPYPTSAPACSWARPSYSPHYGLTYSDEPNAHYNAQPPPPSYMLPNTDPMNNINSMYLNNSLGRAQQANMWTDHVSSAAVASTMATSNESHVNSAYGLQGTENAASFHAVNTSSTDRILPTPSASRTLPVAPQSSLDTHCLSALSSHRGSLGWTDTPSSTSVGSSRTSNSTDSESRMVSAGAGHDLMFGYAVSPGTQDISSTTTSNETPDSPQENRRPFHDDARVRTVSEGSNSFVPSPTEVVGNYGYTSDKWPRNQGALSTGDLYRRAPSVSTARVPGQQCGGTLPQDSLLQQDCSQGSGWQSHSNGGSVTSFSNSSSFSAQH